jgi:hypothetical protein
MKIASVGQRVYEEIEFDDPDFKSSKFRRFGGGIWEELSYSSDCVGHWAIIAEPELFEEAYQKWNKPRCSVCGTTENVGYVGGYQPYRCLDPDCIPF